MYGVPVFYLGVALKNTFITTTSAITSTNYNWYTKTLSSVSPIIYAFGRPPVIVTIGDSIMESSYETSSFLREYSFNPGASWIAKMSLLNPLITYQARGEGGNAMYQDIQNRIVRDVISIKPKIAVINGGVNDFTGGVSKANFLAAFKDVLDQCTAANIIPVVWSLTPDENVITANYPTRDGWNSDLQALVATYPRARWIDLVTLLGAFRAGGAAGNLWNWNPTYRRDGLHPNAAGDTAIASYVYSRIIGLL
jgi:lysophospholipase L1-like esterase